MLLTDVLDSHIGTHEKIKIFNNQLGAVASVDTHARYSQDIVQKKQMGNSSAPTEFVAISVDNIDFLQSHAAVYNGEQHRSWHGTTIQALLHPMTQENPDSPL